MAALLLPLLLLCALPHLAQGRRLKQSAIQTALSAGRSPGPPDDEDDGVQLVSDEGSGYNESEAEIYANFAQVAYCQACAKVRWSCGAGCSGAAAVGGSVRLLGPGARHQVRGFVAQLPESGAGGETRCIVSFRGSSNVWNWMANVNFVLSPFHINEGCRGCHVHRGFAEAYEELEWEMWQALSSLGCNSTAVTGHSLGGAVAALAAYRIRTHHNMVADPVYLFAAPRVGGPSFARSFVKAAGSTVPAAWRVIHAYDPVPRVPPDYLGFRHFPREVYYKHRAQGRHRVCSATDGEDRECAARTPLRGTLAHGHLHNLYVNVDFGVSEDACVRHTKDNSCNDMNKCRCDAIRRLGRYTDFRSPVRYAWESASDHEDACSREMWEHMSLFDMIIHRDARCTPAEVNPVDTCECRVDYLSFYRESSVFTWETVSTHPDACSRELWRDHISSWDRFWNRVRRTNCKVTMAGKALQETFFTRNTSEPEVEGELDDWQELHNGGGGAAGQAVSPNEEDAQKAHQWQDIQAQLQLKYH